MKIPNFSHWRRGSLRGDGTGSRRDSIREKILNPADVTANAFGGYAVFFRKLFRRDSLATQATDEDFQHPVVFIKFHGHASDSLLFYYYTTSSGQTSVFRKNIFCTSS